MGYTFNGITTISGTGTLTTAGKTFSRILINGTGITVTLGDAITFQVQIELQSGTFNTASYNVTGPALQISPGTKGLTLGSSTVTLTSTGLALNFFNTDNFTFSPGTSTFVLSGNGFNSQMGAVVQTFNNLLVTNTGTGGCALAASNWNNITVTPATGGTKPFSFAGDVSATSLTVSPSAYNNRVNLRSDTPGTIRTLTVGTLSADHCDFEGLTLAGAASPASPTGAGDCGGNSGINFPSPKTVYRVGTDTTWAGSSSWSTSSGGTGSNANFPLPQDTAIIDNATTGTSVTFVTYNRGALDMSSRTSAFTLNVTTAANFYGSFILGSGVTLSGTTAQTYRGRTTSTLTTAGKTLNFSVIMDAPGGTLQLGSALSSTASVSMGRGTFDAVSYNVTLGTFSSSGSGIRTVSMGSGLWTLTSTGTVWNATATNFTLNKGTADVLLSNGSSTAKGVTGAGLALNKLTLGGATSGGTTNLQAINVTELASIKTVAHIITLTSAATNIIGTWSVAGTAGNVVTLNSSTVGTQRTIALTNVTSGIDYLAVQDIGVTVANRFYVGANSTNNGNNTNVYFTATPAVSSFSDLVGQGSVSFVGIRKARGFSDIQAEGIFSSTADLKFGGIFRPFDEDPTRMTETGDIRIAENGDIRIASNVTQNSGVSSLVALPLYTAFDSTVYVKVLGEWKVSIPYANVGNEWVIPEKAYQRISGRWKRIS
jgi:hypothetical protein